jgi:hypothetical protein
MRDGGPAGARQTTRTGDEKALACGREICISAQSGALALRGICVATDLDDIPARPLWKR